MDRTVILNFIADNYTKLQKIKMTEMTIAIYGMETKDEFVKSLFTLDRLFVYNVKLPRIYLHEHNFSENDEGILNFANETSTLAVFSKDEFNFDIEEPFNKKNIPDLDFKYMYLVPFRINDFPTGALIIYAEEKDLEFNISNNALVKLYENLSIAYVNKFNKAVNEELIKLDDSYHFFLQDHHYVLDEEFYAKLYEEKSYSFIEEDDDTINEIKKKLSYKEVKLSFPYDNITLCTVKRSDLEVTKPLYRHLNSLTSDMLNDKFTAIYLEIDEKDDFEKIIDKVINNYPTFVFAIDSVTYFIIINTKLTQSMIKELFKPFSSIYYVAMNAPRDITRSANFNKIVNYLQKKHPLVYAKKAYHDFLKEYGEDGIVLEKVFNTKEVTSSTKKNVIGVMINNPAHTFKYEENAKKFALKTINILNKYVKTEDLPVYAHFECNGLTSRKAYEMIKKYVSSNKSLNIIIHYDNKLSKNDFYALLCDLKNYGVKLYGDSSIFLNLELTDGMKLFDGLYIKSKEFLSIQNSPLDFVNVFVTYFYNDNKTIIFEHTSDLNKDLMYEDELLYFV